MKLTFFVLFLISALTSNAAEAERKVSNSVYFTCVVEREGEFLPNRNFRRTYHFPFPQLKEEFHEVKGSLRWNKFSLEFHQDGKVLITLSERIKNKLVTAKLNHDLGKDPQFNHFKLKLELKGEAVVPYHFSCGPEYYMRKISILVLLSLTQVSWGQKNSDGDGHDHKHEHRAAKKVVSTLDSKNLADVECVPTSVPSNLDKESQLIADKKWYGGALNCDRPGAKTPPYEIMQVNEGFYIMRQNKCINFEAPFIYLTIGEDSAFLFDTGATENKSEMPIRDWVDSVLKKHPKGDKLKLVVAHSHNHGDHTAGDNQFADRPNTTIIGTNPTDVAKAFNVKDWPKGTGSIDLGKRKLSIIPIPGHEPSSIAVYDHKSGDMLTGDSLYPGNIFLDKENWKTYKESVKRLHRFSKKNPVRNILGAHIEMSAHPKQDFEYGATHHPDEHRLPLYQKHLDELNDYTHSNKSLKGKTFDDFTIPDNG